MPTKITMPRTRETANLEDLLRISTGQKFVEDDALEKFDPEVVRGRLAQIPEDSPEVTVFRGCVAKVEVDISGSTYVRELLVELGFVDTFFSGIIKEKARPIAEKYNGFDIKVRGDDIEYVVGDIETAVRSSFEVTAWVDRYLSEAFKFNVGAREIAKEMGLPVTSPEFHKYILSAFDTAAKDYHDAQKRWMKKYAEIDELMVLPEQREAEMAGRILTKTGILYALTELKASRQKDAPPELDYQGDIGYIHPIMSDKEIGFLHVKKDTTLIFIRDKITDAPGYLVLRGCEQKYIKGQRFFVYEPVGIEPSEHPTLDGRVTQDSPFAKSFDKYTQEVNEGVSFLAEIDKRNKNTPRSWVNLSANNKEGNDKYKRGRAKMVAKLALGTIDQIIKIYDDEASSKLAKEGESYFNVSSDYSLRSFVDKLRAERDKLKIGALLYCIGGSHERAISGMATYPTVLLPWEIQQERLEYEAVDAASAAERTKDLRDMGLPDILRIQNENISEISNEQLALLTMMYRSIVRFVHHTSYRSWKTPLTSSEAILAVRNEFPDIFVGGQDLYRDHGFKMIDNALTNLIGLTTGKQIYKSDQMPLNNKK